MRWKPRATINRFKVIGSPRDALEDEPKGHNIVYLYVQLVNKMQSTIIFHLMCLIVYPLVMFFQFLHKKLFHVEDGVLYHYAHIFVLGGTIILDKRSMHKTLKNI